MCLGIASFMISISYWLSVSLVLWRGLMGILSITLLGGVASIILK